MSNTSRIATAILACTLSAGALAAESGPQQFTYPAARRADVVDEYFGVKVADPYRWMEEADSKEIAEWVAAQNRLTLAYLEGRRCASISGGASPSSGIIRSSRRPSSRTDTSSTVETAGCNCSRRFTCSAA